MGVDPLPRQCDARQIGDVAILSCKISFTAARSMEIQVNVERESMVQSTRQVTNRATLWYVTATYGTTSKADTRVPFSAWTLYNDFDMIGSSLARR